MTWNNEEPVKTIFREIGKDTGDKMEGLSTI